jgi:hypothetical protein
VATLTRSRAATSVVVRNSDGVSVMAGRLAQLLWRSSAHRRALG